MCIASPEAKILRHIYIYNIYIYIYIYIYMYMSLNLDPNNWKVASRKSEAKRCEDH